MALPSLPWRQINDFLLQVCSARCLDEFNRLIGVHLSGLIPGDFPILCLTSKLSDLRQRAAGKDSEKLIDPGTLALAGEPSTVADFNGYFRFHLPMYDGYFLNRAVVDFRPFSNTEFVMDFIQPRNVRIFLGSWFRRYTLVIPRAGHSRPFSEREIAISQVITPHLENFYEVLCSGTADSANSRSRVTNLCAPCVGLTQREGEIATLLAERLSMEEIAERFFISRRTVEKHAENIYLKLGVRRKRDLAGYLSAPGVRGRTRTTGRQS